MFLCRSGRYPPIVWINGWGTDETFQLVDSPCSIESSKLLLTALQAHLQLDWLVFLFFPLALLRRSSEIFVLLDALGVSLDAMVKVVHVTSNEEWSCLDVGVERSIDISPRRNHVQTYEKGHFVWHDNHQLYESTYITYYLHREELHNDQ